MLVKMFNYNAIFLERIWDHLLNGLAAVFVLSLFSGLGFMKKTIRRSPDVVGMRITNGNISHGQDKIVQYMVIFRLTINAIKGRLRRIQETEQIKFWCRQLVRYDFKMNEIYLGRAEPDCIVMFPLP